MASPLDLELVRVSFRRGRAREMERRGWKDEMGHGVREGAGERVFVCVYLYMCLCVCEREGVCA